MFKPIALRCARVLAAALATCSLPAVAAVPAAEFTVLAALFINNNGSNWTNNTNWGTGDPCDDAWYGITCNAAGTNVVEISLPGNNLVGTPGGVGSLPANFNALTRLEEVRLSGNRMNGHIPDLSGLNALAVFSVGNNELTGTIPPVSLPALTYFDVSENRLAGAIPALDNVPLLEVFAAENNLLTRDIPPLDAVPSLDGFYVGNNQLTGVIPPLVGLAALEGFDASNNRLTGPVPALPSGLIQLNVHGNDLSGPVPAAPALLAPGRSELCLPVVPGRANNPNLQLSPDPATNTAWNAATGEADWNAGCRAAAAVAAVPTLGPWALMGMGVLLASLAGRGGIGVRPLRKRRKL